ncbi:hypothetical protein EV363DRAFT_1165694, partial [Boletus edulis]
VGQNHLPNPLVHSQLDFTTHQQVEREDEPLRIHRQIHWHNPQAPSMTASWFTASSRRKMPQNCFPSASLVSGTCIKRKSFIINRNRNIIITDFGFKPLRWFRCRYLVLSFCMPCLQATSPLTTT